MSKLDEIMRFEEGLSRAKDMIGNLISLRSERLGMERKKQPPNIALMEKIRQEMLELSRLRKKILLMPIEEIEQVLKTQTVRYRQEAAEREQESSIRYPR